jgi:spermidine/putrescine transport system ATP-binding protein
VLRGRIEARNGSRATVRLERSGQAIEIGTGRIAEGEVELILRPETLTIRTAAAPGALAGKILSAVFQGALIEYGVDVGGDVLLRVVAKPGLELARDTPVWIGLDDASITAFGRASQATAP